MLSTAGVSCPYYYVEFLIRILYISVRYRSLIFPPLLMLWPTLCFVSTLAAATSQWLHTSTSKQPWPLIYLNSCSRQCFSRSRGVFPNLAELIHQLCSSAIQQTATKRKNPIANQNPLEILYEIECLFNRRSFLSHLLITSESLEMHLMFQLFRAKTWDPYCFEEFLNLLKISLALAVC